MTPIRVYRPADKSQKLTGPRQAETNVATAAPRRGMATMRHTTAEGAENPAATTIHTTVIISEV